VGSGSSVGRLNSCHVCVASTAEGHTHGVIADQSGRQALGKTDGGSQRECPPARGLAAGARTLGQSRPQGLAGTSVEDGRRRMRSWGEGLQHGEPALVNACIAGRTVGAVQRRARAIVGVGCLSALARRSWPRRTVKADAARRPVSRLARSSAVSGRTNKGVCIWQSIPHAQRSLLEVH